MSLINCKDCGKLHQTNGWSPYCPDCRKGNAELSRAVRSFLQLHPHSTVMDVHRKMGVPLGKLLDMQKEHALR